MVGAIMVYKNQIIGEGWHQKYGEAHAEVNAIHNALQYLNSHFPEKQTENSNLLFRETQLYVSLEPCSHFGKTPPCTDLIIFHNIPRVIIGCMDSNPLVGGKGIEKLRSHGIHIILGVLENECRFLNRRFFKSLEEKRPYIILKWAETENHLMAPLPYKPFWISSELSNRVNHRWRTEEDAILIGKNTAILDNPRLTSRLWTGKNPIRVLLDWNLETPRGHHIFNSEAPTFVFNGKENKRDGNIQFIELENRDYSLQFILFQLYLNNIQSVIVEGGASILNQFINLNIWDEARIIRSCKPNFNSLKEWEGLGIPSPKIPSSAKILSKTSLGKDTLSVYSS